jgi:hypothetical protein
MLHKICEYVQNWLIFVLFDVTPCSLVLLYGILEKHALSIFRVAKSEFTLKTETAISPWNFLTFLPDYKAIKQKRRDSSELQSYKNSVSLEYQSSLAKKKKIYKLKYFSSTHFKLPKCQLLIQVILGINCRTTKIMKLFYLLQKFYVQGVPVNVCSSSTVFIK